MFLCLQCGAFVSEPAILVKRRHRASQVWAMEKFENKIIDMRDVYEEWKEQGGGDDPLTPASSSPPPVASGERLIVVRNGVVVVCLCFALTLHFLTDYILLTSVLAMPCCYLQYLKMCSNDF